MKQLWKNKTFWRWALLAAIGVTTLVIWALSLRSASASSQQSDKLTVPLVTATEASGDFFDRLFIFVRKMAHFLEFFGLGLLWGLYRCQRPVRGVLFYGLLVAVVDEILQYFTPGRSPGFWDVVLDYCGYFCGLALVFAVADWLKRRKLRQPKK